MSTASAPRSFPAGGPQVGAEALEVREVREQRDELEEDESDARAEHADERGQRHEAQGLCAGREVGQLAFRAAEVTLVGADDVIGG
jgi:hypothetical protein